MRFSFIAILVSLGVVGCSQDLVEPAETRESAVNGSADTTNMGSELDSGGFGGSSSAGEEGGCATGGNGGPAGFVLLVATVFLAIRFRNTMSLC